MEKVHKAGGDVGTKLSGLQTGFKKELLVAVNLFIAVAQTFRQDFEENGPLIPGLSPMDAAERLKKYQRLFQDRKRNWTCFSKGETLFGLQVTQYPELVKTKKKLELLDKMYSLYVNVVQQTATCAAHCGLMLFRTWMLWQNNLVHSSNCAQSFQKTSKNGFQKTSKNGLSTRN